jgi:hypothetical protein
MWSMSDTYDGPCGSKLVEPMNRVLTGEARRTILNLKEEVLNNTQADCPSIQIYRAVLDFGVSTPEGLTTWLEDNSLHGVVTDWMPTAGK